jgi:hypothetical protein
VDRAIAARRKQQRSIVETTPLASVLLIAPAKVLHGAVRVQGFASSPTPATEVFAAADAVAGRRGRRLDRREPGPGGATTAAAP